MVAMLTKPLQCASTLRCSADLPLYLHFCSSMRSGWCIFVAAKKTLCYTS